MIKLYETPRFDTVYISALWFSVLESPVTRWTFWFKKKMLIGRQMDDNITNNYDRTTISASTSWTQPLEYIEITKPNTYFNYIS